jgi:pyridoxal phosphate enzyme (YggS family)
MSEIAERLSVVKKRIAAAGRDVLLIAVSKTHSPEAIRAAYDAGQRDFGENYVQELVEKAELLSDLEGITWHMIGHLQRNKVRPVVKHASVLHTIDSKKLVEELGKRVESSLRVLIEVNVAGDEAKSGCRPGELDILLEAVEAQPKLRLAGLMTVPPHTEDPAGARPFFDQLVEIRDANGGIERLPELSMGMTHDLEHAIAAGATMVRVGTAIFGARSRA